MPIETDPARLKMAMAYISTVAELHNAARVLQDNMRELPEAQQKLLAAAAVSVINKLIRQHLDLVYHYLTPIKESITT